MPKVTSNDKKQRGKAMPALPSALDVMPDTTQEVMRTPDKNVEYQEGNTVYGASMAFNQVQESGIDWAKIGSQAMGATGQIYSAYASYEKKTKSQAITKAKSDYDQALSEAQTPEEVTAAKEAYEASVSELVYGSKDYEDGNGVKAFGEGFDYNSHLGASNSHTHAAMMSFTGLNGVANRAVVRGNEIQLEGIQSDQMADLEKIERIQAEVAAGVLTPAEAQLRIASSVRPEVALERLDGVFEGAGTRLKAEYGDDWMDALYSMDPDTRTQVLETILGPEYTRAERELYETARGGYNEVYTKTAKALGSMRRQMAEADSAREKIEDAVVVNARGTEIATPEQRDIVFNQTPAAQLGSKGLSDAAGKPVPLWRQSNSGDLEINPGADGALSISGFAQDTGRLPYTVGEDEQGAPRFAMVPVPNGNGHELAALALRDHGIVLEVSEDGSRIAVGGYDAEGNAFLDPTGVQASQELRAETLHMARVTAAQLSSNTNNGIGRAAENYFKEGLESAYGNPSILVERGIVWSQLTPAKRAAIRANSKGLTQAEMVLLDIVADSVSLDQSRESGGDGAIQAQIQDLITPDASGQTGIQRIQDRYESMINAANNDFIIDADEESTMMSITVLNDLATKSVEEGGLGMEVGFLELEDNPDGLMEFGKGTERGLQNLIMRGMAHSQASGVSLEQGMQRAVREMQATHQVIRDGDRVRFVRDPSDHVGATRSIKGANGDPITDGRKKAIALSRGDLTIAPQDPTDWVRNFVRGPGKAEAYIESLGDSVESMSKGDLMQGSLQHQLGDSADLGHWSSWDLDVKFEGSPAVDQAMQSGNGGFTVGINSIPGLNPEGFIQITGRAMGEGTWWITRNDGGRTRSGWVVSANRNEGDTVTMIDDNGIEVKTGRGKAVEDAANDVQAGEKALGVIERSGGFITPNDRPKTAAQIGDALENPVVRGQLTDRLKELRKDLESFIRSPEEGSATRLGRHMQESGQDMMDDLSWGWVPTGWIPGVVTNAAGVATELAGRTWDVISGNDPMISRDLRIQAYRQEIQMLTQLLSADSESIERAIKTDPTYLFRWDNAEHLDPTPAPAHKRPKPSGSPYATGSDPFEDD